jgi:hypothetical protein
MPRPVIGPIPSPLGIFFTSLSGLTFHFRDSTSGIWPMVSGPYHRRPALRTFHGSAGNSRRMRCFFTAFRADAIPYGARSHCYTPPPCPCSCSRNGTLSQRTCSVFSRHSEVSFHYLQADCFTWTFRHTSSAFDALFVYGSLSIRKLDSPNGTYSFTLTAAYAFFLIDSGSHFKHLLYPSCHSFGLMPITMIVLL